MLEEGVLSKFHKGCGGVGFVVVVLACCLRPVVVLVGI